MADEDDKAQKTEPATPRKKEDARKKGQVAQSKELQSAAVLGSAVLVFLSPLGAILMHQILQVLSVGFGAAANPPSTLEDFHALTLGLAMPVALTVFPMIVTIAVFSGFIQVVQTGPMFSPEALAPKMNRISLIAGIKRFGDLDRLVELGKALLKLGSVFAVSWFVVTGRIEELVHLASVELTSAGAVVGGVVLSVAFSIVAVLGFLAILDLAYQRWRFEERLKMSKREVRDEMKQSEGDPALRGRFRERHRELSRSRMIAAVADADAVIMNPTHYAVALKYDRETMAAPKVIAKGRGHVALRMREAAQEYGVAIIENPPLARLLHKSCEVGREVPEKLFQAVAEVLAYVYKLDPSRARRASEATS